jgi:hypothetical protein
MKPPNKAITPAAQAMIAPCCFQNVGGRLRTSARAAVTLRKCQLALPPDNSPPTDAAHH